MSTPETPARNRSALQVWALIVLLVLLAMALFGDKGLLRVYQAGRQKAELEAEIRRLEQVNAGLRRDIEALHKDRRTIENIARKELGMVREDELVYQFRSPGTAASQKAEPGPVPADR